MSKHTPGPWTTYANSSRIISKAEHHPNYRAWVGVAFLDIGESGVNGQEATANARLIAAAPELLDCAKFALELLRTGTRAGAGDCIHGLIQAIAKAEGTQ